MIVMEGYSIGPPGQSNGNLCIIALHQAETKAFVCGKGVQKAVL